MKSDSNIAYSFLILAAIYLLCGVILGIAMGITSDFALAPVHAHLNLLGWVSCAIFGIVYQLFPELADHRLARTHFWLAAVSAAILPIGIALSILYGDVRIAIVGSLGWFAATLLFVVILLHAVRPSREG